MLQHVYAAFSAKIAIVSWIKICLTFSRSQVVFGIKMYISIESILKYLLKKCMNHNAIKSNYKDINKNVLENPIWRLHRNEYLKFFAINLLH